MCWKPLVGIGEERGRNQAKKRKGSTLKKDIGTREEKISILLRMDVQAERDTHPVSSRSLKKGKGAKIFWGTIGT